MAGKKQAEDAKFLGERILFRTRRFSVVDAKVRIRGKAITKPFIRHNDCVELLVITGRGGMVLERSYRPDVRSYVYELPAGTMEAGEKPRDAAIRELKEETGITARKVQYMFSGHPMLGYDQCKLHFFLMADLEMGRNDLEDDEEISIREFSIPQVYRMLERGEIKDLSVPAALHYYSLVLSRNPGKSYREP